VTVNERLGLGPARVNQGPIKLGYLMEAALRAAGGDQDLDLVRFSTRFLGNVFAGDRVDCTGTVTGVDEARRRATLDLRATVGDHDVLQGTAEVAW
jgi:acyl dehydratase